VISSMNKLLSHINCISNQKLVTNCFCLGCFMNTLKMFIKVIIFLFKLLRVLHVHESCIKKYFYVLLKFIMVDILWFHPSSYQHVWKGDGCENLISMLDIN
jgi:hypothetical protein